MEPGSNKPKIGILTTFYNWDPAYSLVFVVESQLKALVKYGYNPVLFVHDNFKDDAKVPAGVEIRKIVPRFLLVDYSSGQTPSADLNDQANKAYEAIKTNAADIDYMIEHDILLQGWFLPYAMALHKLGETTQIKWLHWIHSNVSGQRNLEMPHKARFTLPANSKLVYLNNYYLIRVAETYGIWPKDVRIVYNAMDPRLFLDLHPLVETMIDKYDLLAADLFQVYPVSTTRMIAGKQLKVLIEIFAKLKAQGKKIRLVVANAHANDKREKQVIAETLSFASQLGLNQTELIFTSLEDVPTYELGVPKKIVSQLFQLANLFIFPSVSENCSLILLEAMLSKNLLVLNESVPSMREFGKDNAIYFKFGGNEETVNYADRDKWLNDVALIIISEFQNNKALKAANDIKQHYNYDWIFKHQIEPLFYES